MTNGIRKPSLFIKSMNDRQNAESHSYFTHTYNTNKNERRKKKMGKREKKKEWRTEPRIPFISRGKLASHPVSVKNDSVLQ